jgi:uncharacterized protein YndB with AHSA1/START domain
VTPVELVIVTVEIAAPVDRVWRALTVPSEVTRWDGVTPSDVPEGYPAVGHHARWRTRVGPVRLTLHDRIGAVDPMTRLASSIDVGFVHVDEEYRLEPSPGGTTLVSHNEVRSRIPGLGGLVVRLAQDDVEASMGRLKVFCEEGG